MKDRPQALPGETTELYTHCGKIYITVNRDPNTGEPVEVFARFGKAGGCGSAVVDGLTRITSYALRAGLPASKAVKAFSGIQCQHGSHTCLNALAEVLEASIPIPQKKEHKKR